LKREQEIDLLPIKAKKIAIFIGDFWARMGGGGQKCNQHNIDATPKFI
jgi:hypothetical protein